MYADIKPRKKSDDNMKNLFLFKKEKQLSKEAKELGMTLEEGEYVIFSSKHLTITKGGTTRNLEYIPNPLSFIIACLLVLPLSLLLYMLFLL